ncbi:hypothetical protein CROQUDRAFT_86178 [Cronartium quercuum f. sp. fusiforme G11]|uniref:Uncharacterized protein n=1 Tax=Cronartium quercuum f. sp. fusiforme G11 TaxID=708437 RepID=A0A9P6NXG4_9BASI|nr:hypothetical protein CROQUDRAFT_86178 [Cronartium quercuum f. sp. fusiforme G11]
METQRRSRPRTYKARNVFYLRVSPRSVLMFTLLLDHKHVNWMTETTFERILNVLRPRLLPKLKVEAYTDGEHQKKTKLDVYRGQGFQMGFYFRKNTPRHAVLLKTKELIYPNSQPPPSPPPPPPIPTEEAERIPMIKPEPEDDDPVYIPPSTRENSAENSVKTIIVDDDDEQEFKPELKVSYTGFSIFGRTLVVVVEPFPALSPHELSLYNQNKSGEVGRELSVFPSESWHPTATASTSRPLFRSETPLPDDDGFLARTQAVIETDRQEDDDDTLPDFSIPNSTRIQSVTEEGGGLLTDLIKNPNSDREKDPNKRSSQNLTLDQYVLPSKK